MRTCPLYQRIAIAVFILAFFELGYTWTASLNRHAILDGATALDRALPLVPAFVVFYMLGYLMPFLSVFVTRDRAETYWVASLYVLILCIAFVCFALFPIRMHKTLAYGSDIFSQMTYFQQRADTSFNCFPSLHVALNVFCCLFIRNRSARLAKLIVPLTCFIVVSTLLVKQHLVVDVVGGAVLAGTAFIVFTRYRAFAERYSARIMAGTVAVAAAAAAVRFDEFTAAVSIPVEFIGSLVSIAQS